MITTIVCFFALKGDGGQWHRLSTGGCTAEEMERMWKQLPVDPDDLSHGIWYEVWQASNGKVHVVAPTAQTA